MIFTTTDFTFKSPFQFSSLPHLRFRVPLTIGMKTVSIQYDCLYDCRVVRDPSRTPGSGSFFISECE